LKGFVVFEINFDPKDVDSDDDDDDDDEDTIEDNNGIVTCGPV
jgi:hypothetical protein